MVESSRIQTECIELCFNLSLLDPLAFKRIHIHTFQYEHSMLEHIQTIECLRMSSGEIDVPSPIDMMNLRCPDEIAHRARFRFVPYNHRLCVRQRTDSGRTSNFQPVIFWH
ncbi:hypothetical protein D3C72_1732050 [compost metagenome]